jgi:hypothetical protein
MTPRAGSRSKRDNLVVNPAAGRDYCRLACCGVGPNQVFEISEKSIKISLEKGVRRVFLATKRAI